MPRTSAYTLTSALVAAHGGGPVVLLAAHAEGQAFRLHATRPDASHNHRVPGLVRADQPSGAAHVVAPVEPASTGRLIRVDISGPIEQRAGFHDPCSGWTDGNDAIAERLEAAFAEGNALLVIDSPGGAYAGAFQAIARAQAAKAKFGRYCIVWADECIASLGYLWAASIGDEIHTPDSGQLGSIGARGGHGSIAGALALEGVEVSFFVWPDDGKIALAPERALSELGRARGDRDVAIAGEAFCAAVVASPIGVKRGLTRDAIVALRADMLTGQAAVDAGLADSVSTLPDVTAYALALAESGSAGGDMDDEKAKAEGEPDKDKPEAKMATCAKCSMSLDERDAFCSKCGTSTIPDDEDKGPPSSKKPEARAVAAKIPAAMAADASLGAILGIDANASLPAQKTAAIGMRRIVDLASKITGQKSADGILGALLVVGEDASRAQMLMAESKRDKANAEAAERMSLSKRLVACGVPGRDRGEVFADVGGKVLTEEYATMGIGVLRGIVERSEANVKPRSPFVESREKAEAAANAVKTEADGGEKAKIDAAMRDPSVLRMFNAPNNTHSLGALATEWVKSGGVA